MSAKPDLRSTSMSRRQRRDRTARALTAVAETSSERRRQELLDYVVRINMGVARTVAGRYFHRGIDEDDLIQVAYMALTRAARDFDASRHQDFLSYAVPTIRGELKKHFRDQGWMVRPPRRVQEAQARITRAEGALSQELGRPVRPSELAEHLDMDLDDVIEALAADGCFAPSSLDRPVIDERGHRRCLAGRLPRRGRTRPHPRRRPGSCWARWSGSSSHATGGSSTCASSSSGPSRRSRTRSGSPRCRCRGCSPGSCETCAGSSRSSSRAPVARAS